MKLIQKVFGARTHSVAAGSDRVHGNERRSLPKDGKETSANHSRL